MKKMIFKLLIIVLFITVLIHEHSAQKYPTKYDDMNIDDILKSERLLENYIKCLMDQGPCTPDGSELKSKYVSLYYSKNMLNIFIFRSAERIPRNRL